MSQTTVKDIYRAIDELEEQIEDLEEKVNEMPVFIKDLIKQNLEQMKK